jgi:hypothetical protein
MRKELERCVNAALIVGISTFSGIPEPKGGKNIVFFNPTTASVSEIAPLPASWSREQVVDLPSLEEFKKEVMDGSDLIKGVYVKGLFALPVLQQPNGDNYYVTRLPHAVSQFRSAANDGGSIGLLAHNDLAGKMFFNISKGTLIQIIYGNGKTDNYEVTDLQRYEALTPNSDNSRFIEVDENNQIEGKPDDLTILSSTDVFYKIYSGSDRLVFQTCINGKWGRFFAIAEKRELYQK